MYLCGLLSISFVLFMLLNTVQLRIGQITINVCMILFSFCVARLRYTKCAVFIYTLSTSLIHCRQKIIIVTVNLRLHVSLCCVVHQLCSFYAIKYCTVKNWTNYNKCMCDIIFVFSYHYPLRFDLTFTFSHNICKSSFSLYISLIVLSLSLEISNKREHHK